MNINSADFEKVWQPFIRSIIHTRFSWLFSKSGTTAYAKIRRSLDYDDLLQVAYVALLQAAETYDDQHSSGAKFKSYAYSAIHHQLLAYIENNLTPVKTPRLHDISPEQLEGLQPSFQYHVFSDLEHFWATSANGEKEFTFVPPDSEPPLTPSERVEETEFHLHCMGKLESALEANEFKILIMYYEGISCQEIGETLGASRQYIDRQLTAVKIKCMSILYPERCDLDIMPTALN